MISEAALPLAIWFFSLGNLFKTLSTFFPLIAVILLVLEIDLAIFFFTNPTPLWKEGDRLESNSEPLRAYLGQLQPRLLICVLTCRANICVGLGLLVLQIWERNIVYRTVSDIAVLMQH